MYMQSERPVPPKNYSGSAFSPEGELRFPQMAVPEEETAAKAALHEAPEEPPATESASPAVLPAEKPPEVVPTMARPEGKGGFLSHFPFLSSLLPPPRREGKERLPLPDWVLLGAVALLFLSDGDNDILPFLLLLLLWD